MRHEIPERTFHRHKDAIKELFDIDIYCDRSVGKKYHKNKQRRERIHGGSRIHREAGKIAAAFMTRYGVDMKKAENQPGHHI